MSCRHLSRLRRWRRQAGGALRCLLLGTSLLLTCAIGTGCESMTHAGRKMMHELQPHRLRMWNRGPGPSDDEIYFSVSDPIGEAGGLSAAEPSSEAVTPSE